MGLKFAKPVWLFLTAPVVQLLNFYRFAKIKEILQLALEFSFLSSVTRWANFSGVLVVGDSSKLQFNFSTSQQVEKYLKTILHDVIENLSKVEPRGVF